MGNKIGCIRIEVTASFPECDQFCFERSTDALCENLKEYIAHWIEKAMSTSPDAGGSPVAISLQLSVDLIGKYHADGRIGQA